MKVSIHINKKYPINNPINNNAFPPRLVRLYSPAKGRLIINKITGETLIIVRFKFTARIAASLNAKNLRIRREKKESSSKKIITNKMKRTVAPILMRRREYPESKALLASEGILNNNQTTRLPSRNTRPRKNLYNPSRGTGRWLDLLTMLITVPDQHGPRNQESVP
jgi:hypothetical protein